MFSGFSFGGVIFNETMISQSVAILAFVLLITNVLDPFFVKGNMTFYFKHHHDDAVRVFKDTHPELLESVYDENGNYRRKVKSK